MYIWSLHHIQLHSKPPLLLTSLVPDTLACPLQWTTLNTRLIVCVIIPHCTLSGEWSMLCLHIKSSPRAFLTTLSGLVVIPVGLTDLDPDLIRYGELWGGLERKPSLYRLFGSVSHLIELGHSQLRGLKVVVCMTLWERGKLWCVCVFGGLSFFWSLFDCIIWIRDGQLWWGGVVLLQIFPWGVEKMVPF